MESANGGASNVSFPVKLRAMLDETEAKGLSHIVSWEMEGTAFRVHDPEEFVKQIMGQWFNQTKYKSFQRQLNLYGFIRVSRGPQKGCYIHEKFQKELPEWTESISRKKVSDDDFTEAELIAPAWLPDATRTILEPTPLRDTTQEPSKAMMDAFESYFQTKVVKVTSSPPPVTTTTTTTSSKNHVAADSFNGICSGNALQRFLDNVLETDGSSHKKPHAVSQEDETDTKDDASVHHKRTSRSAVFPDKLHDMLDYCETNGLDRVCCWEMDGRAFRIRSIDLFSEQVMPKFFKLTKFESLQRQLNLYSFTRIARGSMKGCYYHPLFVRGGRDLSKDMQRRKPDDSAMSSIALPDACKSLPKKRRISIPGIDENDDNTNNHEGASSTGTCTMGDDGTSAMQYGTSDICHAAVHEYDELDMMARDCFDSQSNSGGMAIVPSGSSSYNFPLSAAMIMSMGMSAGNGVSRMPVPSVSPQGMVRSVGWQHPVFTGNQGTMNLGEAVFRLASQTSLR